MQSYNLTEAKAKLSSIISRVIFAHERITIKRKGRNVAVVVPYEDYIQKWTESDKNEGLIAAKGALADMEELNNFIDDIYRARRESTERSVEDF
ncbi:MAG: type II toxin-antitoxin system Phd/YefM family antitoxin [Deltaproteobacteria bacterium]|nr:type II toxin-antitoxin system Phd/YefM family antitoxin [Deltaproteobacteria bacterium]